MTSTTTDSQVAATADTAKDQASQVAQTSVAAAGDVAGTAKEQGGNVVSEAVTQTQNLVGQATDQITAQAGEQTQRLSNNIRQLAQELSQMANSGKQGSTAKSLVSSAADRADRAAGYLDGKQPGDLVDDLQNLGRRRPAAFLLGAAVAGIAVGRLVGGAKRAAGSSDQQDLTMSTSEPPLPSTASVADPQPPVRNNPPGAATVEPVEPYPVTAPITGAPATGPL